MKKSRTHYRIVREMSACGTDGVTTNDPSKVTCKGCLKKMPSHFANDMLVRLAPKLSLGRTPPMHATDVSNEALDSLLRAGFIQSSDELQVALGVLVATLKEHRHAFTIRAATSTPEYEELLVAIAPVIKALGVSADDA